MAVKVLVLASPETPELALLKKLPETAEILATGKSTEVLASWSDELLASVSCLRRDRHGVRVHWFC